VNSIMKAAVERGLLRREKEVIVQAGMDEKSFRRGTSTRRRKRGLSIIYHNSFPVFAVGLRAHVQNELLAHAECPGFWNN